MEDYVFEDVLAGSTVTCGFPGLDTRVAAADGPRRARTLFFPGCSLINYALPLVKAVYDLLAQAERVEGISLLCCGKILSFEPDGKAVRAAFEDELCAHVAAAGVERIVAACPNCVAALRGALAEDERTAGVEVVPLPLELEALGYRVDAEVAKRLLAAELEAGAGFSEVCAEGARPPTACGRSCPPSWRWSRRMRAGAPSAAARSCGRRGMRTRRSSSRRRAGPRPWRPAARPSWRHA